MKTKLPHYFLLCISLLFFPFSGITIQQAAAEEINKNKVISGLITDEKGELLPGVSVLIKGTTLGTTSNLNGEFSLTVPNESAVIIFSYIGYESVERKHENNMKVVMKENSHALNEVEVTTQKRTQTSIEVPAAVSALDGNSIKKLNLNQFDQLSEYIPGVQIQIQSPNNPGYVVRGVTSDDGAAYAQPRVSIFQDGISISRSPVVELFDIERVEVVKGPQGTLFGRGAEIGAVHVIRNKAANYLAGEVAVNYGTHNQQGATGFINTPLVKDKLANRLAFSYDARDGFIDNVAGGKLNGKSSIALRNSTRLYSGENTVMDLILDYQYDDYPGTSFKSNKYAPAGGDTDPNTFAGLEQGRNLYIKRKVGGAGFLLDHQFNNHWTMSSLTGFCAHKSTENFDADGTPAPILFATEKQKGSQFSQEFRINYDSKSRFTGFAGVSYFYENAQQKVIARSNEQSLYPAFASSQMKNIFNSMLGGVPESMQPMVDALLGSIFPDQDAVIDGNPNYVTNLPDLRKIIEQTVSSQMGFPVSLEFILRTLMGDKTAEERQAIISMIDGYSNKALLTEYQEEATNYGINQAAEIYADGTINIIKNLSATVGIRGSYEHQKSGYYSPTPSADGTFGILLYQPSDGKYWSSKSYGSWVGRAAINYLFGRNNIYTSVSRGRRPGVIAVSANSKGEKDVTILKPEIITSYEGGIKGLLFKGKLNYDFCTYYYKWNNFQTSTLKDNGALGLVTVPDDAGRASTFGIEASLIYSPVRFFNIFGNYSYIDGKFDDVDENGIEQEYAGNRFRLTPKHSFSAGLDITIPVGKTKYAYFRPSYSYKSKVFFEDNNRPDLVQDGYGLANFTAGYRVNRTKMYYEIGAFGKNVFDTKYIIDAGNSGDNIGLPTFVAGSKSVFGVQLKVGF